MTKRFNLEDEIVRIFNEAPVYASVGYRTELADKINDKIKEAVKILKEGLFWNCLGDEVVISANKIIPLIDKIFGDLK